MIPFYTQLNTFTIALRVTIFEKLKIQMKKYCNQCSKKIKESISVFAKIFTKFSSFKIFQLMQI